MQFKTFLGLCALNGRRVAVYTDESDVVLEAETTGGNPIWYRYNDELTGAKKWTAVQSMRMSESEYEAFRDEIHSGTTDPQDAIIVQRALERMGHPSFED